MQHAESTDSFHVSLGYSQVMVLKYRTCKEVSIIFLNDFVKVSQSLIRPQLSISSTLYQQVETIEGASHGGEVRGCLIIGCLLIH